jgi:hypothetical protein
MDSIDDQDAAALGDWIVVANRWAEASQELVAAGSSLASFSYALSKRFDGDRLPTAGSAEMALEELAAGLGVIATDVEEDTRVFRDRFLETAANLEQYHQILG